MKHKSIKYLLGCLITAPVAMSAHAQSSMTLYGIADLAVVYMNNSGGHSNTQLTSGMQGSRWGLRGSEDLGQGTNAIFAVENGFALDTGAMGQAGTLFGRQAWVGLSNSRYGSVTLGRQYDSVVDFVGLFPAGNQWASIYALHPGDIDNLGNSNRVNNAVKYRSVQYGGFSFGGLYGFGEVPGSGSQKQIWSLGANYNNGPLSLGAGYVNVRDPNYSFFGNNAGSSTTGSNMSNVVYSAYASANRQQIFAAGGSYAFGATTVGFTYSNTSFTGLGSQPGIASPSVGGGARFNIVELNLKHQLSPALVVGIVAHYTKGYDLDNTTYRQVTVGADYAFSKRTDVFVTALYQRASGADANGRVARAAVSVLPASSDANQFVALTGIRHKF